MLKKERGITLIALIVTIIVIIIVAGITISAITGNKGIVNQAEISKNKSERQEIIENAKTEVTNVVMENVGTDLTRSQLKEILDKYFDNVPDDYTLDTELTTKSEYGNYKIKVSEIYDRTAVLADNSNDTTTPVNTSSTNTGNTTNSSGNTSNDSNSNGSSSSVNNSTSTSNTLSSETTEGSENNNTNQGQTNSTREPEEINTTGVKLDNKSIVLDLNGEKTIKLNATPTPSNANKNTTMKWTSKKKKVATVTQNGTVTGKSVGNSTIMASTPNGKSAECLAVCQAKITGITINPVNASIQIGETIQLTAEATPSTVTEKITWKTNNEDVAKVNRNGIVTAVGNGKTIIIAQNPSGTIKATCTVTVTSGENKLMLANTFTEDEKKTWDEVVQAVENYKFLTNNGDLYDLGEYYTKLKESLEKLDEINSKIEKIQTMSYLRGTIPRGVIESIKFKKGQVPTSGVIEQFDASAGEDGSIIGYYTDEDNNELYELTIISDYEIIANNDSSMLFAWMTSLKNIDFENLNFKDVTNMKGMFYECSSLTSLDMSEIDTSKVTDMGDMFYGCSVLGSLDLRGLVTNKVTDMSQMFYECNSLISLDVSGFDTSQVMNMNKMFYNCTNLASLNLNGLNTSKVTDMSYMFYNCTNLTSLDVSKLDTSRVTSMKIMFGGCTNLTSLDVKGLNTSQVIDMSMMFYNCTNLTSLNLNGLNTSRLINMSSMFCKCDNLTSLDLGYIDTSQVTDMSKIFYKCSSLASINLNNFNTSKVKDMYGMFGNCSGLTSLEVSNFDTSQVTKMGWMFYDCTNLPTLDVSNFNTSQVTDMDNMFYYCDNLTTLDVSNFNTGQVTDMNSMFEGCSNLTNLDVNNFETSKVKNMNSIFKNCSSLTSLDVSNFETSQVTDMMNMFYKCSSLTSLDVSNFDTRQVKCMRFMFGTCSRLSNIDVSNFNTSQVTDMMYMFYECSSLTSLDLSNFDTSQVKEISNIFYGCSSLISLNLSNFNTSQVTYMENIFYGCSSLTSLDVSNFDTSQVTKMGGMFYECNSLTSLDLSNFNTSQVTNMDSMFWKCSSLTTIYVSKYDETTDKGWTVKNVEHSFGMFYEAVKLVGGNGTKYNSSNKDDETYARIDEAGQLGYLTDITKKGIRLDKYNIILDMSGNKTAKLTATISQDISNKNSKITWTTSDSTKVQVDQEGNITAKAITTSNNAVTITATTSSGYNASCLVVVKSSITSISVSPTSGNMEVNQTLQLTLVIDPETTTEKITWKSRNKDVAKVDNNGKVTAIGNGKVEIIAQNPSGTIKAICTLTVTEAIAPEPPTITPDYNEELGTIEINVNLSSIDENMESTNSSELINSIIESEKFNVGIFLDEDGTILAFEDYNKEIKFENSNSTTVSYNNIPEGTYYIFALDEDGNPINVSSFWTGNTNYMLSYNFGTDMNETNSVTVKSKSKQQVVLNYVVTIVPDGS